jgi:hypothetical protein
MPDNKEIHPNDAHYEEEAWEDELEEQIHAGAEIRTWEVLREQINSDLKKKQKTLTGKEVTQLLLIRNFATLRLKGHSRIAASIEIAHQWHENNTPTYFARRVCALARHYQLFEQLPQEKRGGTGKASSLLNNPSVKHAARNWLASQASGQVTPHIFHNALNTIILPMLNIQLKKPLCERTARRWLIKLGWRLTVLRKGVYMDGHERPDVVEYRNSIFLPKMAKYEKRMTHFEGPELRRVEPTLAPGEKEIVAYFHDECCFHVNDFKEKAW